MFVRNGYAYDLIMQERRKHNEGDYLTPRSKQSQWFQQRDQVCTRVTRRAQQWYAKHRAHCRKLTREEEAAIQTALRLVTDAQSTYDILHLLKRRKFSRTIYNLLNHNRFVHIMYFHKYANEHLIALGWKGLL